MKIAYVITRSDEVGGAHIHVRDMASWMLSRGHEVRVFVGSEGPFTELLSEQGIEYTALARMVRQISPLNDFLAVRELKQELIKYSPDLVSSHSGKAGLIARVSSKLAGFRCIFTAHGWSFSDGVGVGSKIIYGNVERILARWSQKIITVCESDRQLAIDANISTKEKIVTIHNGMPFVALPKDRNEFARQSVKLVMVARFERQKDHHTLMRALSEIKDYEWTLDLVGDGPLMPSIKNQCIANGIYGRVRFLGRRNDVHEILDSSDIFILSTHWEGFPRSILEAMRACLPVVASRVAGIPEAVEDGRTGFLISPGDSIQMAEKVRTLIEDPTLRFRFGQNARSLYERNFTFDTMAERTLAVYSECAEVLP